MNHKVFIDTNVILYLLSADTRKADRAEAILADGGIISVQVLNEAAAVCLRKLQMPWPEIEEFLVAVRSNCQVENLGLETHDLGLHLAKQNQLSIYDAMIVSAAKRAGAEILLSEDMQHQQVIDGIRVVDPFR